MADKSAPATSEARPISDRFRELPDPIPLEDTIAVHEAEAPPDPTMGRDPDRDFMLRYGMP